jgi:oxygen-dependent protoporphyrinogen oxidase
MAATWALRRRDVVLLEASDRLGGRLLSHPRDPYWLNLGGHLFPGAGSAVGNLVEDLGLKTIQIPGSKFGLVWNGKVYSRKRVELYPVSLPMSLRERVAFSTAGLRILRAVGRWRKAQTPQGTAPHAGKPGGAGTFRSVVGHPPRRVAEVFEAAARRSSTELDDQSAETAGQLFAGVWAGKKSSLAFNLDGGSGRLAQALSARMGGSVELGCEVGSVEADGKEFVVSLVQNGETKKIRCRSVIVATPAPVAAHIAGPLPDDVRDCLTAIAYGAFVSMAALTSETEPSGFDQMYAVTTPGCSFDMIFNHANPLRTGLPRVPGGSLMVYAGGDRAQEMLEWPEKKVIETFVADILRIFPHLNGRIAETCVQKWPIGLSFRRPGSDLAPIRQYVASGSPVQLCGDYFGDLGNMEIAASSGVSAARRVLDGLDR